jgi:hypothetical protein
MGLCLGTIPILPLAGRASRCIGIPFAERLPKPSPLPLEGEAEFVFGFIGTKLARYI